MGEVKHTPGPWYAGHMVDDDHRCNCRRIVDEGYAGGIATIHADNGIRSIADGGNDCPPLDEAKANARLIAAAPELLAALKLARTFIRVPDMPSTNAHDHYTHDQLAVIDAVIAKAESSHGA